LAAEAFDAVELSTGAETVAFAKLEFVAFEAVPLTIVTLETVALAVALASVELAVALVAFEAVPLMTVTFAAVALAAVAFDELSAGAVALTKVMFCTGAAAVALLELDESCV